MAPPSGRAARRVLAGGYSRSLRACSPATTPRSPWRRPRRDETAIRRVMTQILDACTLRCPVRKQKLRSVRSRADARIRTADPFITSDGGSPRESLQIAPSRVRRNCLEPAMNPLRHAPFRGAFVARMRAEIECPVEVAVQGYAHAALLPAAQPLPPRLTCRRRSRAASPPLPAAVENPASTTAASSRRARAHSARRGRRSDSPASPRQRARATSCVCG